MTWRQHSAAKELLWQLNLDPAKFLIFKKILPTAVAAHMFGSS